MQQHYDKQVMNTLCQQSFGEPGPYSFFVNHYCNEVIRTVDLHMYPIHLPKKHGAFIHTPPDEMQLHTTRAPGVREDHSGYTQAARPAVGRFGRPNLSHQPDTDLESMLARAG